MVLRALLLVLFGHYVVRPPPPAAVDGLQRQRRRPVRLIMKGYGRGQRHPIRLLGGGPHSGSSPRTSHGVEDGGRRDPAPDDCTV